VSEHPGLGLSGTCHGEALRLGSRAWCGLDEGVEDKGLLEFAFRRGGNAPVVFQFEDALRPDAAETVARLKAMGLAVHLLSGDREAAVQRVAEAVGIGTAVSRAGPQAKLAYIDALSKAGARVLMVEDIITTGLSSRECLAAIARHPGEVVGAAVLIDRSAGKADIGVPLVALASYFVPDYAPDDVPPEMAALPAVKPGSRGL